MASSTSKGKATALPDPLHCEDLPPTRAVSIVEKPGYFFIQGDPDSQVVTFWDRWKLCWIYSDPETRFNYEVPLNWLRDKLDFYLPCSPLHGLKFTPVEPPPPETYDKLLDRISQPPTPVVTSPVPKSLLLPRNPVLPKSCSDRLLKPLNTPA